MGKLFRESFWHLVFWTALFIAEETFAHWYKEGRQLPEPARTAGAWGIFVLIVAIALWRSRLRIRDQALERIKLRRGIVSRRASISEADDVWRLCRSYYQRDDHVININTLKAFMAMNGGTVRIFEQKQQTTRLSVTDQIQAEKKSVGLCIVFAINKKAVEDVFAGRIKSAQDLTSKHSSKDRGRPAALYVTNVCGTGWMARGIAQEGLAHDLYLRVLRYPSVEWILGRRANDNQDGHRIIRRNEFSKTREDFPNQQIWKLSRQDFLDLYKERFPEGPGGETTSED